MSATRNNRKPRFKTAAEILSNAYVSEDPKRLRLDLLPANALAQITLAKANGYRPVCVYWADGVMAIMLLAPGHDMPDPTHVVRAYQSSVNCSKTFPKGELL